MRKRWREGRRVSAIFLLLFIIHCAPRDAIVARVDGIPIRTSFFQNVAKLMKENYDPTLLQMPRNSASFRRAVLERLIQESILVEAAAEQRIAASEAQTSLFLQEQGIDPEQVRKTLKERGIDDRIWMEEQRRRLIIGRLTQHKERANFEAWYQERRKEASVEVYEDVLQAIPLE